MSRPGRYYPAQTPSSYKTRHPCARWHPLAVVLDTNQGEQQIVRGAGPPRGYVQLECRMYACACESGQAVKVTSVELMPNIDAVHLAALVDRRSTRQSSIQSRDLRRWTFEN